MISVNWSALLILVSPIPYGVDGAPRLRSAPVSLILIVSNIILYFATHLSAHGLTDPSLLYEEYGLTPAMVHWVQLLTYMFLHVSVAHVLWNMLFLYLFGPVVERRLGSLLFAALYLMGGAAAGLLHTGIVMHFAPNSTAAYVPLVGASGAISAVLGLFAVFAGSRSLNLFWPVGALLGRGWQSLELPAGIGLAIWLIQTLYGAATSLFTANDGGIAYFAHLGGFAFGMGCGLIGGLRPVNTATAEVAPAPQTFVGVEPSAMARLLEQAVDAGDCDKALLLLAKCRVLGLPLSARLVRRLSALAAASGHADRAAELSAYARNCD